MRIRLTIEYDLDDPESTLESERADWIQGHIDFQDCYAMRNDPDLPVMIKWEEVK